MTPDSYAEEAVLGAVLIDPATYPDISDALSAEDFYFHKHRWIWDSFLELARAGQAIDTMTVTAALDRAGQLAEVGGVAYLARLINVVPTSQNAESYARIVQASATRRRLMEAAGAVAKLAMDEGRPVGELVNDAQATLSAVAERYHGVGEIVPMAQAVSSWYEQVGGSISSGHIPGVTTGYKVLDSKTLGLKRKELSILAGRPSMGKTSLAAQSSIRQARAGLKVGVFTLEESKESWVGAAALAELGIDRTKAGPDDLSRILHQANDYYSLPIQFYEKGFSTRAQIEQAARRMGELDVIWIDHLGYIDHLSGDESRIRNLPYLIGVTTKRLAAIAKSANAAVIALCQLHRENTGQEPQLTDLRDSGEIEQDARQVWFIHTPGYYSDNPPPDDKPQEARILVRKNHDGPTGKVKMAWVKAYRRFAEWEGWS